MATDQFVQQLMEIFGAGDRTAAPGSPGTIVDPQNFSNPSLIYEPLIQKWQQDNELAKAHYDVMKTMKPDDRMEYLRNIYRSRGVDDATFNNDPFWHGAQFMHEVFNKPGSVRDFNLSPSDAALFFGFKGGWENR